MMKPFLTGTFLVLFITNAFAQSKDAEIIKRLNEAWLKCYPTRDSSTLSQILADDFVLVSPRGTTMNKSDVLNNVGSDAVKYISVNIDSVSVRMLRDDVAVITCKTTFAFTANNKETTGKNCYSDVYMKRNGKWNAVTAHVTLLSMQ